jgi:hypothetical protein
LPVREERSLPGLVEQRRELLTTESQERRTWAAFSLVTFSLAAQEKVTSRRAAPGKKEFEKNAQCELSLFVNRSDASRRRRVFLAPAIPDSACGCIRATD